MSGKAALLDTNIFISARAPEEPSHVACKGILDAADRGRFTAVVSTITLLEVLVGLHRAASAEDRQRFLHHVQTSPHFRVAVLDVATAALAAPVRHETSLDLPDAVLMATARGAGVDSLVTNDKRLLRAKGSVPVVTPEAFFEAL